MLTRRIHGVGYTPANKPHSNMTPEPAEANRSIDALLKLKASLREQPTMPVSAKCPACHGTQKRPAEPGAKLTCELCGEPFTVPLPPPPAAPPPPPNPEAAFNFE